METSRRWASMGALVVMMFSPSAGVKSQIGRNSDRHIHAVGGFAHGELLQAQATIADIDAVAEMKFVAVPWADDVDIVFIKTLAQKLALVVDLVDDLRHAHAL